MGLVHRTRCWQTGKGTLGCYEKGLRQRKLSYTDLCERSTYSPFKVDDCVVTFAVRFSSSRAASCSIPQTVFISTILQGHPCSFSTEFGQGSDSTYVVRTVNPWNSDGPVCRHLQGQTQQSWSSTSHDHSLKKNLCTKIASQSREGWIFCRVSPTVKTKQRTLKTNS